MSRFDDDDEENPWGEMVRLANQDPVVIDVETGKEQDVFKMADPRQTGDSPLETPPSKSKTPSKSKKDEMEEYIEEFEKIIKLKNDYDKKITKAKKDFLIKEPNASVQEKKEDFEKKKKQMKCLNCGKPGGTIFSKDLTHVSCGNTEEPCELNIQIEKPTVINMPDEIENLTKEINANKRTITEYKLDLLFDLDDEEVILAEFQNHKDNLDYQIDTPKGTNIPDKINTCIKVNNTSTAVGKQHPNHQDNR